MMKRIASLGRPGRARVLVVALLMGVAVGVSPLLVRHGAAELNGPQAADRQVALAVATLMQRQHVSRAPIDDKMSERCLTTYLKTLDPMKLYFYQSDIDEFNKFRNEIDDQIIKRGDTQLAYTIFKRLLQRIDERVKLIDALIEEDHEFTVDEEMTTDRDKIQYPRDATEARERWRKRIKYDLLVLKADKTELKEAKEKLHRRYSSFAKRMKQTDNDELLEMYLSSLTMGFDPHTNYMSGSSWENFEISMKLELDGIGASLQFDDGFTVVHKIIPGGAADKDGRLKPKDRVVAVGQGDDADDKLTDVVDMKLNDVVNLIRGKRGTIVRLGVLAGGQGPMKIYDITRDRIELKDSEARSEIITDGIKADGSPFKVGVIDLPSFYMDMSGARLGNEEFKSTTRDVKRLLDEFKSKGVDAVVIDLRRNGGGSLTEAINLTGLFIDQGPVVMVKGPDGRVEAYEDREPGMAWSGPLVVLTSKFSASASEIFAGALQDYHRALIVGDKATHGKGTVQQVLNLGQQIFRIPNAPQLGVLKLTIQQFYRPSGDSTQNRGVLADVELPSITTHLDVAESDLDFALKFDQVPKANYKLYNMIDNDILKSLRDLTAARQVQSDDFKKLDKSIKQYLAQKEQKSVTLNEVKFLAERAELDADRAEEKQIEELNDPNRPVVKRDYYFNEALGITRDYVHLLQKGGKLAAKQ